jgi:hypothetical protein
LKVPPSLGRELQAKFSWRPRQRTSTLAFRTITFEATVYIKPSVGMVNMKALSLATAVLSFAGAALSKSTVTKPASSQNILLSTFKPPQVFKNSNIVRSINLEKSYPRDVVNVIIENISPEAQDEYYIPFTTAQAERLGNLEVRDKKNSTIPPFIVEAVSIDGPRYDYATARLSQLKLIFIAKPSSTRFDCPRHWRQRENRLLASATRSSPPCALCQQPLLNKINNSLSMSFPHTGHRHTPPKSNRPTSSSPTPTSRNTLVAPKDIQSQPKSQAQRLLTGLSIKWLQELRKPFVSVMSTHSH